MEGRCRLVLTHALDAAVVDAAASHFTRAVAAPADAVQVAFEIEALLDAAARDAAGNREAAASAARRGVEIRLQQLAAG